MTIFGSVGPVFAEEEEGPGRPGVQRMKDSSGPQCTEALHVTSLEVNISMSVLAQTHGVLVFSYFA